MAYNGCKKRFRGLVVGTLKCTGEGVMVVKQQDVPDPGVMLIGFNPVVREGLQAILAKDEHIEVMGDL